MSEQAKRYRAFISYSQKDKVWARRIHQALENYRLPRGIEIDGIDTKARKLGRLFRDDDEMGAATNLGTALQGAIADAENLIVVCSPNAAKSHWVNEEIIHFKRTSRADRIFAVIVSGEPTPGPDRREHECFPPALRFEIGSDGALTDRPTEPLGLDVRKEPFNRLVVRLAAGLVRTPFDALWKREQRRARARATASTLSAAAILFVLGGAITQSLWRPELDRYLHYSRFAHSTAALGAARPGATFRDCDPREHPARCPEMVVVPHGQFLMGSAADDQQGVSGEGPIHPVSVSRFAVSKYEITFDDWQVCVGDGGCAPVSDDSGWGRGNRPVMNVSWEDAQQYVHWLAQKTGKTYRLLSEAEWEYAARGVTRLDAPHTQYPWGNNPPVCDHHAPNGALSADCPEHSTLPVGSFLPNAFGLYDMAGNVKQWVEDCYAHYDPAKRGSVVETDSAAAKACHDRVLRSGSWFDVASHLRSAARDESFPADREYYIGFRVARSL